MSAAYHSLSGMVTGYVSNIYSQRDSADHLSASAVQVPEITCPIDKDNDGIDDLKDIVAGARAEVMRKPQYRSAYYQGGYPPATEGVCTDLV